jgi:hypothetical protein
MLPYLKGALQQKCIKGRLMYQTIFVSLTMEKKGMTTKEAFMQLTSQRGWHKNLPGVNESSARGLKKRLIDGDPTLTNMKMEELLEKAGAKVIQEKLWEI